MVDDREDPGRVDRGRQFGRVVGIDDHHLIARRDIGDDFGLGQVPVGQNEGRFGVGLAQKAGLGLGAFHLGQVPRPDQGRAGRIGVGGFVAENEGGHGMPLWMLDFGGL